MHDRAGYDKSARRPRDLKGIYAAAGLLLLGVVLVLSLLAAQLIQELARLKSASSDNVQWSMAQVQVELLMFESAVDDAIHDTTGDALADVRQRFDIFYSRIVTLRDGPVFSKLTSGSDISSDLNAVADALTQLIPVIDGPDDALAAALPVLNDTAVAMRDDVRQITLSGVRFMAEQSDKDRQAFSSLLLHTGLVTAGVMAAMFMALFLAVWQFRIARIRSEELQTQNLLYESAINASLEAIIVSDETGRILDFNPAAENLFGYKREHTLGVSAEKLIIPKEDIALHRERRKQFLETYRGGDSNLTGRFEINAMRASGEVFPAEVSVGLTRSGDGRIIVTYMRDISDRKRVQRDLTQARDDAVATAKAKSDFLAVMSHEMRTPLNGVMGLLDMLNETRLSRKQRDYVETAIASGEILQGHIDNVLDITRIESGVARLTPSRFDVTPLLTEIKKMNDPAANARGNSIEVDVDEGAAVFQQDRHGLRQILINLVGNAVKFTENGQIRLRAASGPREGWLEFSVSDTGIGISEEDRARIFDDFIMLDPSYKRTAPGSGLGLGISRRIAELMGGEIGVDSTPGEGSRFYLRVPALEAVSPAPAKTEPENDPLVPALQAGLSVLLVEDNETNRFVAREMLAKHGCRIVEAHDGIEGVEKAEQARFDVIFMDVSMPRLDGIGATRAIREGGGLSAKTTIIGLTAHALPDERLKLSAAGMDDCIIKPLRSAKVRQVLASLTARQDAESIPPHEPLSRLDDFDLIDHETLAELAEALPPELFVQQLERFRHELSETRWLTSPDPDQLAAQAHKMAGSAAVFGALALRSALLELESNARLGANVQLLCAAAEDLAARTHAALADLTD
ncbi:ATP-binding protein [Martelella limonii]|uniref:ATP-binding protein n=1 Tax=Martelella limonii TaxID=1647649 RepID=UPI001581288D|nr:ATP-binding protein [Martelella limonii]